MNSLALTCWPAEFLISMGSIRTCLCTSSTGNAGVWSVTFTSRITQPIPVCELLGAITWWWWLIESRTNSVFANQNLPGGHRFPIQNLCCSSWCSSQLDCLSGCICNFVHPHGQKAKSKNKTKIWQADLDYCTLLHDHVVMVGSIVIIIIIITEHYKPLTFSLISYGFYPSPGSLEKWMHWDCVSSVHSGACHCSLCAVLSL